MKKVTLFAGGLLSGLILSQFWKPLTKAGIKLGVRTGHKAREISEQALEDFEDLRAEAMEELRAEEELRAQEEARAAYSQESEVKLGNDREIN